MRIFLAVALVLGLSGCADIDLFGDSAETPAPVADQSATPTADLPVAASAAPAAPAKSEPPAVTAARSAPPPSAAVSTHCKTLAKLRAGDAAFQGEDSDTQTAVYNGTYRDCVAWDAAHRS